MKKNWSDDDHQGGNESMDQIIALIKIRSLAALVGLSLLHGCSSAKQPPIESQPTHGIEGRSSNIVETEEAAAKTGTHPVANMDPRQMITEDSLIDAYYKLTTATLGTQTCTGNVSIKVSTGLKKDQPLLHFPEGVLDCGPLGKIQLKSLLKIFTVSPSDENVEVMGNAIRLKKMGNIRYTPARPYLPAFLSAKPSALAKLNIQVAMDAYDEKTKVLTKGVAQIRMLGFAEELRSTELKRTFHDVMRWESIQSGFEGIDKGANGIADRFEWTLSLNPLAILGIKIQATAKDLIDSFQNTQGTLSPQMEALMKALPTADGTGIIDQLIGKDFEAALKGLKVELHAVLVDQKNLTSISQKEDSTSKTDADGVQIGK